ncbi:MAG: hypothetical protein IID41_17425 [Planctomycetes bacterium]|nr:hypothetical protein [Planctomycetota bacterium]
MSRCKVSAEQDSKPGFCCRKCDQWIGDVLYQADITNATAWDDWCLDCYMIHCHGGGRLKPKARNAQILFGLSQGFTQQEVADHLGLSQPRINQILKTNIVPALIN